MQHGRLEMPNVHNKQGYAETAMLVNIDAKDAAGSKLEGILETLGWLVETDDARSVLAGGPSLSV